MKCRAIFFLFSSAILLLVSSAAPAEPVKAPAARLITSFENGASGWEGGTVVADHATDGLNSLMIAAGNVRIPGKQDWTGYDYLIADIYNPGEDPLDIYAEVDDTESAGYWTRVNIYTIVVPGASKLILPVKQLYVGEKGRPGRMLKLDKIKLLAFAQGSDKPKNPFYIDNVRLEKDLTSEGKKFDTLTAFSFGTPTAPVMDCFTRVTKDANYSKEKGYGWKDAKLWRDFNFLQPEPLYQTCVCPESGNFVVDLPNGKYHIFMNIDNPSGFWGEYQAYSERTVIVQGTRYTDTVSKEDFKKKYYRFWNVEDSPSENTFDKYQAVYYKEKEFDAEVTDGRLSIGFEGANFSISLSALVIYPDRDADKGKAFLDFTKEKRRFYFDNYFKRVLHRPTGAGTAFTSEEKKIGFSVFSRDFMDDIYYNDMPAENERTNALSASAFAGEYSQYSFAVHAVSDLGAVTVSATSLSCGEQAIPADRLAVNFVSNRVTRLNMDGSSYSIKPRYLMPFSSTGVKEGVTKWFWITIKTPADAKPGIYTGLINISSEKGGSATLTASLTVNKGKLDAADTPLGPFYFGMDTPLKDPDWNRMLNVKSIEKMKEYGMTAFSSAAGISYKGFVDGKPALDFTAFDEMMEAAKKAGFTMPIVLYGGGVRGFNPYFEDTKAMVSAGFKDYSEFIKAVYTPIQKHADENKWLPVYFCLGDEPIGDNVTKSMENAAAYRKAFPNGNPSFTIFSSFRGKNTSDPHYLLGKQFQCPSFNGHDEDSIKLLKAAGSDWSFYNNGSRWTYGIYLYKAVKEFDCKYRLSWHWNMCAGDPYYALDCREDDYCWANSSPAGDLILTLDLERNIRTGIDDYRRLLTLSRLEKEKAGTPAAESGRKLIDGLMTSFKLGESGKNQVFNPEKWRVFRENADKAITGLR